MNKRFLVMAIAACHLALISCNNSSSGNHQNSDSMDKKTSSAALREEKVSYSADGTNMDGFVVYSDSMQGRRPGVLIVHEWWGLNDYPKERARELARMGYI